MIHPFTFFGLFLKASLFSTGGFGNLPSLHDDLLRRGWSTERSFAESLMIGQISPGPNGLWTVCLGYLTYGFPGALLSTLAITLPPLLITLVDRFYARIQAHPAVEGFLRGMGLTLTGISVVTLLRLLKAVPYQGSSLVILLGAAALGLNRRVPVVAIFMAAALAGLLLR